MRAFLAVALAASGAIAQVPAAGPIAVQPVQIGPPRDSSGAAERQRAQERDPATPPAAPRAASPPPPAPLSGCNAGGCWDSQGRQYNGTGDGSRYLSPEGRLCQTHGKFIHCN